MKRLYLIFVVFVGILLCQYTTYAYANNDLTIKLDGKIIDFPDAKPFIDEHNRTQVPIRFIAEQLGARVNWDGDKNVGTIMSQKTIALKINEYMYWVNQGMALPLDTKPVIIDNRTFVPLRFVSEVLGAQVDWDAATFTADIKVEQKVKESTESKSANELKIIKSVNSPITKVPLSDIKWRMDRGLESVEL